MKSTSNDSLLTQLPSHHHQHQQKYYEMRPSSIPNGSTNGFIINNYAINGSNIVKRCLCHMMKGVHGNIQKCVAALVLISFFSIIFFTQYMDSPTLVGWVLFINWVVSLATRHSRPENRQLHTHSGMPKWKQICHILLNEARSVPFDSASNVSRHSSCGCRDWNVASAKCDVNHFHCRMIKRSSTSWRYFSCLPSSLSGSFIVTQNRCHWFIVKR